MNTVSAPEGITAPVKMRIASPGLSAALGRRPAVSRPADDEFGIAGGIEIGIADGVAVNRGIIERRQVDRRLQVDGGDAAARAAQRHAFGFCDRHDTLGDQPLHLAERQQRPGNREANRR